MSSHTIKEIRDHLDNLILMGLGSEVVLFQMIRHRDLIPEEDPDHGNLFYWWLFIQVVSESFKDQTLSIAHSLWEDKEGLSLNHLDLHHYSEVYLKTSDSLK